MTDDLDRIVIRLDSLEKWQRQVEIASAKAEERERSIMRRLDSIDSHLKKSEANLGWAIKILLALVIGAVGKFMLQGGFAGVV